MKRATLAAACAVLLQSCAMAPRAPSAESDLQAAEARIDAASMIVSIEAPAQAQEQQAPADCAKQSRRFVETAGLDAATRRKLQLLSRLA